MQNKPNLVRRRRIANSVYTRNYENFNPLAGQKNKPNSNPIKANLKRAKMNINSIITKDYRKKDDFLVRINKPNLVRRRRIAKMNVNAFSQKDYENKTAFRPQKNKPKTNPILSAVGGFPKGQNELKIARRKIRPHLFQQTKKKFWTVSKRTVRIKVMDNLLIYGNFN